MKRILKDYFTFSKKERLAVFFLLLLIAAFIAALNFYSVKHKPPFVNKELGNFIAQSKNINEEHDSLKKKEAYVEMHSPEKKAPHKLFYFDPNTISEDGWERLGIADKTIKTILNYRNKGGKFRAAADIRKIWGLRKQKADQLIPYVQLAETVSAIPRNSNPTQNFAHQPLPIKQPNTIDINTATSEEWQSLPGIGLVLANRIIKFRDKLGGFHSIDQIRETYGIKDSVFSIISPYLRLPSGETGVPVAKLDLNKASAFNLKMSVSIPEAIAKSILVYRQQYGPFKSVEDLKKIIFISDTMYARISQKLSVE